MGGGGVAVGAWFAFFTAGGFCFFCLVVGFFLAVRVGVGVGVVDFFFGTIKFCLWVPGRLGRLLVG